MEVSEAATISLVREWCRSGDARRIRQARRLSLAEVAATIGTSGTQLARWERGEVAPRKTETILRYAELLAELLELGA